MELNDTGKDDRNGLCPSGQLATRRHVLAGLALAAGGIALPPCPDAVAATAALPFTEVADGIFVRYGLQQEMSAQNGAAIANIGFVVGDDSVAVIDTGTTTQQGAALKAAIARATDKPVSHVIATHVHLDHCFGHGAFASEFETGTAVNIGHHRLPRALAERGGFYLDKIRSLSPAFADTRFIAPTTLVAHTTTIDLGKRRLTLEAWPAAHTDSDLTIHDTRTNTLWAADLLFGGRIPVLDGSLNGWLSALDTLAARDPARVVPGHGPADGSGRTLLREQAYLTELRDGVRTAIAEGLSIDGAVSRLSNLGRGDWLLFDTTHGRNIVTAYTELEWE